MQSCGPPFVKRGVCLLARVGRGKQVLIAWQVCYLDRAYPPAACCRHKRRADGKPTRPWFTATPELGKVGGGRGFRIRVCPYRKWYAPPVRKVRPRDFCRFSRRNGTLRGCKLPPAATSPPQRAEFSPQDSAFRSVIPRGALSSSTGGGLRAIRRQRHCSAASDRPSPRKKRRSLRSAFFLSHRTIASE